MPTHTVRAGECVASLAARTGTTVDEIWQDPANATLRESRSSPYMLAPGDVIELPDAAPATPRVDVAGSHEVRGQVPMVRLHMLLHGETWGDETAQGLYESTPSGVQSRTPEPVDVPDPSPLANTAYRLVVGGRTIEGTTDADGVLDEAIDARATRAQLVLEPDTEHERTAELSVGYLDPIEEQSGVVQRLCNLGFPCRDDEHLSEMLAAFQKSRALSITGLLDEATRERLAEDSEG